MQLNLIILLFVFFVSLIPPAYACRPLISDEHSKRIINSAAFIGLAKILNTKKTEEGIISAITLRPMFAYKKKDNFDSNSNIEVTFDIEALTSCDYRPKAREGMLEVILFEKEDKKFRLGNKFDMAIGRNWENLRKNIEYIK